MAEVTVGVDIGSTSVKALAVDGDGTVVAAARVPHDVRGVDVAAMVPSLCAVDDGGRPCTPGLLYGDARGGGAAGASPAESGELVGFLRWCAAEAPDAAGYWPAQAVANAALGGEGV